MGKLELIIAKMLVTILNVITLYLKPRRNKITYISYRSNNITTEIKLISDEIHKIEPNTKEVFLMLKYKNTLLDKFRYVIEIIKQVYHVKTSKVVIIDGNNFVISNINKKDTRVVQIWHACGAIKKFGKDFERKYEIKNYDFVITCSSSSKAILSSAFDVKEDQVVPLGYSKTDLLFDKHIMNKYKSKMYKKYPFLKGKKVVLYAPTFRGEAVYDKQMLKVDVENISKSLGDEYILLCKYHPIINSTKDYSEIENLYNVSDESLYKLFAVTDILISDFSAIIYDFSILEKPIILYTPDLEHYKQNRGLYVDYEEFAPGKITYSEEELINTILNNNVDVEKVKALKNNFFDYKDGKSTSRIAKFVVELLKR
ncbi:CDP-glycerol glycerophosphotransferase family protein [Romboutsia hominis]|uniref:CDP-glycerol glycerophosphotransferase family protein n=1 Tax=Romboutsia faecis TaxID=2764597 RepID=A0ABR7JLQ1_9FIRM|nr:CDP-glycerol glycerophosphotransferase family protein [Romboutsia faecis]MBC5995860.1 CDP-glycerol glycerophosphotransferase family protein [Romboutsia faecis]